MSKWNGLERRKPPNQFSLKRIDKLNAEVPTRIALCKRCRGTPIPYNQVVRHNYVAYIIRRVRCIGGRCECGCAQYATNFTGELHPHEDPPRSQGGKVSLEDSIMVLNDCHRRLQGREPKLSWIKDV